jgi:hypothetical protein
MWLTNLKGIFKTVLYLKRDIKQINHSIDNIYNVLAYQKERQKTRDSVIYSCIIGNYDDLIQQYYINYDYDYVCFTDNKKLLYASSQNNNYYGIWKIKKLHCTEYDNTKNSRWHKLHPHILFPDYKESIWIDANINIKSDYLFSFILSNRTKNMIIPLHNLRKCIYEECRAVKKRKLETNENIHKIYNFLKRDNFPHDYGLNETNIIYRKHHDDTVIQIMNMWWEKVRDLSKRDQLSLSYVLWKFGIIPYDISFPNIRNDEANYFVRKHNKR